MSNLRRSAMVIWFLATGVSSSALLLAAPQMSQGDDRTVSATIVEGQRPPPIATPQPVQIRSGDISLNFPSADVRVVAKAVLGDVLKVPYSVASGLTTAVTVVTPKPIARSSVVGFLEEALRVSGLALVERGGTFSIEPIDQARGSGSIGATIGFSNEIYQLQFVSADEMKRLLDPVLPGVVAQADAATGRLTLSGTAGQRASARDLLKQFDVNWLRNMSFALFVPQRSDSRLIVPELEKLINAPDAPTRGLVRLISMEKLNGILAISSQRQYLDDVNRFVEILDREGQNNEPRLFVYRVQNGRSRDLTKTLNNAFGNSSTSGGTDRNSQAIQFEQSPDGGNGRERSNSGQGQNQGQNQGQGEQRQSGGASPSNAPLDARGDGESQGLLKARISSDDTNNAILVYGTPREYALIEDALRKLDILPFQVFIEAAITEVSLTDDLRFGLQWNFSPDNSNGTLTENTSGLALVRNVPGFSFAFSPSSTINGVLNTLETKTKVNVVSAPKLLVLNNQTAVLQVGDQVPIATQNSTATTDPNAPTINSIEYRDTGVILKVTPRVNASGLVLLDVAQEVSDVNTTAARGTGINSPTISTRRISTSVAVQDGEVLALGGLIRNTETKGRVGLPFLSQIPVIGGLFGRQATGGNKIELIVLLKPRVIRTVDDGRAITDELRAKIKTLEPFKSSGKIP
ncbi:MAG: type II secretion system secretin GspD [Pseudomonadota bacterium]